MSPPSFSSTMCLLLMVVLLPASIIAAPVIPPNPGVPNTLNTCRVAGYPFNGYYIRPDDLNEMAIIDESNAPCTPGSYGAVTISYPGGVTINGNEGSQFCGYLPLDGSEQVINW
jgi:hypothetical protein